MFSYAYTLGNDCKIQLIKHSSPQVVTALRGENIYAVLLTRITMLYSGFPELIHLITVNLYPLANFSPFLIPLLPTQLLASAILFLVWVWLLLDSTYKWGHIVFILLWLIRSGSCTRRFVCIAKFGSFFSFFSNLSWDSNYTDIRFLLQSTGPRGFVHFSFLLSLCCSDCTISQFIYSPLCFLHYIANPSTELFFILVIIVSDSKMFTCSSLHLLFLC